MEYPFARHLGEKHSFHGLPKAEVAYALQKNTARPIYALSQFGKKNGIDNDYLPKGAWKNPQKRNWTRYQIWVPPGQ